MLSFLEIALLAATLAFFSAVSIKKKLLDTLGVLIANAVGIVIFFVGGTNYFLLVVLFFAIAEASTALGSGQKPFMHGKRTIGNIFGNSGVAIVALLLGSPVAFFGAMAAALSDTLSSELGMLSGKKPVLITTLKQVERGTDGGVTGLGMWSALAGAGIIAAIHFALNSSFYLFLCLVLAGFFGSAIDSFFGAVFERKGVLGNTAVNFIGSGGGALLGHYLSLLL
jgi:uncharacterized protein (TIGR00297 family)